MQQTQVRQVHKELQDTMAQLDAIRHEIQSISIINPGPMTRRLVDNLDQTSIPNENTKPKDVGESNSIHTVTKDSLSLASNSCNLQSQATTYARLAESPAVKNGLMGSSTEVEKIKDAPQLPVLPFSAENTGLLPDRGVDVKGSDIVLEAILEAEVAHNAKEFFSQPQKPNIPKPNLIDMNKDTDAETRTRTRRFPSPQGKRNCSSQEQEARTWREN